MIALWLCFGCGQTASDADHSAHSENEARETNMEAPEETEPTALSAPIPSELRETEEYDIRLRGHVVNLDSIDRFSTMEISKDPNCPDSTQLEELTFGYACTRVRVNVQDDDVLEVEADQYIFSSTHRLMGQITSIDISPQSTATLTVRQVQIDDIFDYIRVQATVGAEGMGDPTVQQQGNPLHIHRQALTLDSEREFSYENEFEHNFNTTSNPVTVQGQLKVAGQARVNLLLGYSIPDEDEYIHLGFDLESIVSGGFAFNSGYDNVREEEETLLTVAMPLRIGWLYADVIYEAKAKLDADFNVRVGASVDWKSTQTVISNNQWTTQDGWRTQAEAQATPIETTAAFNTSGTATASTGLEFSATVMLYKLLGPKVAITPKLEAEAKGNVSVTEMNTGTTENADGCLEIKGGVDLNILGVVRGMDDTALYESSLIEETIASVGSCEDIILPIDENPPRLTAFQFSISSVSPGGRCTDYSGTEDLEWQNVLRAEAENCIESSRCIFSLDPCSARFPGRAKRGVCIIESYPIEYTYYADVYECPEQAREGFGPCTLVRAREFGDVTWIPEC